MTEPITTTVILTMVAEAFIGALAGKVTDELGSKLKGDPAHNAFKRALGVAIHRYGATGSRLDLTRPLLQKDGPLTEPNVAAELAKLVQFDQEPNAALIGQRWKAALDHPPQWRDFTSEAELLLDSLRAELRATEVFGPVFEAKSLEAIAAQATSAAESLTNIEAQLAALHELMEAKLGGLLQTFAQASRSIRDQIYDHTQFIEDKTNGFVGRQFVFARIDQFIQAQPRGYFLVRGDPGLGKSALMAQLVKTRGYIHHFNIRAEGINKASAFLRNICAQLIAAYGLNYLALPPEAAQDAGFLNKLLGEVSAKLNGDKCVIVVDALDEVDTLGLPAGMNILYLPLTLPNGIFIIATSRREAINLRIDMPEQATLDIAQDDAGNIADVREYVNIQTLRPGIQAYIASQKIDDELFIDHLVEKSQGNFIYVRMVLPEIEKGAYQDLDYKKLPEGLERYYEDHWQRMRGLDERAWFDYKLPVILALTVVQEPVSIELIYDFSGIEDRQDRRRVRAVLHDFDQFVYKTDVEYEGDLQRRYRWYHASFFDFIAGKEEIAEERVDLVEAHRKIADKLWSELFDE